MAFSDHLTAPRAKGGITPLIDTYLGVMAPDEATAARTLLASDQSDRQVAVAFTAEGFALGFGAVRNWREANKVGRFAS